MKLTKLLEGTHLGKWHKGPGGYQYKVNSFDASSWEEGNVEYNLVLKKGRLIGGATPGEAWLGEDDPLDVDEDAVYALLRHFLKTTSGSEATTAFFDENQGRVIEGVWSDDETGADSTEKWEWYMVRGPIERSNKEAVVFVKKDDSFMAYNAAYWEVPFTKFAKVCTVEQAARNDGFDSVDEWARDYGLEKSFAEYDAEGETLVILDEGS